MTTPLQFVEAVVIVFGLILTLAGLMKFQAWLSRFDEKRAAQKPKDDHHTY